MLQTKDLTVIIDHSCFVNVGAQLYIMFQPLYYTLKRLGHTEKIVSWKTKGLVTEKRTTPTTTDNSLSPSIEWFENSTFVQYLKEAA